jgi:hypothetical protein
MYLAAGLVSTHQSRCVLKAISDQTVLVTGSNGRQAACWHVPSRNRIPPRDNPLSATTLRCAKCQSDMESHGAPGLRSCSRAPFKCITPITGPGVLEGGALFPTRLGSRDRAGLSVCLSVGFLTCADRQTKTTRPAWLRRIPISTAPRRSGNARVEWVQPTDSAGLMSVGCTHPTARASLSGMPLMDAGPMRPRRRPVAGGRRYGKGDRSLYGGPTTSSSPKSRG